MKRLLLLLTFLPVILFSQNISPSENNPVIASSYLPKSKVANYNPEYVLDCNFTTAWVEGSKGDGVKEWIEIYLGKTENLIPLTELEIEIHSGYKKSYDAYQNNNVPSSFFAELFIGNASVASKMIEPLDEDMMLGVRNITFDLSKVKINKGDIKFKLTILKVRKGKKYDDAAISEILFDFKNVNPFNINKQLDRFCKAINKRDPKVLKEFSDLPSGKIIDEFISPFNEEKTPECSSERIRILSETKALLTARVLGDSEVFAVFEYIKNKWQLVGFMSTPGW